MGYPCPLPFGPSLRNVQNCSRRFCARPIPGARPCGTCLRQSNFVPDEVVCRPSLACIASRPACGSPKTLPAFLSPCYIALRLHSFCTKSQAKRVHDTQTPVRPPYRSHPAMVIEIVKPIHTKDLSQRAISAPSMTHRTTTKRPLSAKPYELMPTPK